MFHSVAVDRSIDLAKNTQRSRHRRTACDAGQGVGQARILPVLVVDQELALAHFLHVHDFKTSIRAHHDPLLVIGTKTNGFTVLEVDAVGSTPFGRESYERAVVEDVAV